MMCQLGPILNATNILKVKKKMSEKGKNKIKSLVIMINMNHRKKHCRDESLPEVSLR